MDMKRSYRARAHTGGGGHMGRPPIQTQGHTEQEGESLKYVMRPKVASERTWKGDTEYHERQTQTSQDNSNLRRGSSFGVKGPHVGLRGHFIDLKRP